MHVQMVSFLFTDPGTVARVGVEFFPKRPLYLSNQDNENISQDQVLSPCYVCIFVSGWGAFVKVAFVCPGHPKHEVHLPNFLTHPGLFRVRRKVLADLQRMFYPLGRPVGLGIVSWAHFLATVLGWALFCRRPLFNRRCPRGPPSWRGKEVSLKSGFMFFC